MRTQVGTVNILRERTYPRSPDEASNELVTVEPGLWPVYRDDDGSIYWEMAGELLRLRGELESLGDGMLLERRRVEPSGEQVIFRSKSFTLDEFIDFVATDPVTLDGPERRLSFNVEL